MRQWVGWVGLGFWEKGFSNLTASLLEPLLALDLYQNSPSTTPRKEMEQAAPFLTALFSLANDATSP